MVAKINRKKKIGLLILTIVGALGLVTMFILPPLEQAKAYHNFSDGDTILHIPNFWNVISNLPFLIVGILGIFHFKSFAGNTIPYLILFLGIALVSIGSAYYHLNPNNSTLVWDRLPMTVAFMSLFSVVVSEFINFKIGRLMLFPLLLIGISSVFYWIMFDDLKFYTFIQFYPMLAIPIILIFFNSEFDLTNGYWFLLLAYIIAKFFEYYDNQVHNYLELISGHTLKHVFASIGVYLLLNTYVRRKNGSVASK